MASLCRSNRTLEKRQAVAVGVGKSFLLETIFLWAYLHGHNVKAAAPAGIGAARLRVARTPIAASTSHYLFGLSVEGESKIDPAKPRDEGFLRIAAMTVLMVGETPMLDDATWLRLRDQSPNVGATSIRSA